MASKLSVKILGEDLIQEKLKEQRAKIEQDVDASIDAFLKRTNRTIVARLVHVIKSFDSPENGFSVFKQYVEKPDDVWLRDQVRTQDISFGEISKIIRSVIADTQEEQGIDPTSLAATFKRAARGVFAVFMGQLLVGKVKGNLNFRQSTFWETMSGLPRMYEGPAVDLTPLSSCIAPLVKQAVHERLLVSLERLEQESGKPLLNEDAVRAMRSEILKLSYARFDALASESFSSSENPREKMDFSAEQIPDRKFGLEFEGFTTLEEKYPKNILLLSKIFNALSVPASACFIPKTDSKYDTWGITFDTSVINPLYFTGAHNSDSKIGNLGLEIVSRVLRGSVGITEARNAIGALNAIQFRTNRTCGFHVHVSLEDTTLDQRKNLVLALKANEPELDKLIDPGRRGDSNKFCISTRCVDPDQVRAATTTDELVEAINPEKDRNHKFDLTGLVLEDAPETIHYRGEGGASYMDSALDYAIILVRFTQEALDNPDIKLADLLVQMKAERDQLNNKPGVATTSQVQVVRNQGMFVEI